MLLPHLCIGGWQNHCATVLLLLLLLQAGTVLLEPAAMLLLLLLPHLCIRGWRVVGHQLQHLALRPVTELLHTDM
jgi:hypothetical protein